MDKIVFINVTRSGVTVEEVTVGVDFSSRASTALLAAHSPNVWTRPTTSDEDFPASELEDIRNEIDEDLRGLDLGGTRHSSNSRLDEIEAAQEARLDAREAAEDAASLVDAQTNDRELFDILNNENEILDGQQFEISVGSENENAHGKTEPDPDPDPGISEENNNDEKNKYHKKENEIVEIA